MSDLEDLEAMATATHPEPWRQPRPQRGPTCSAGHEYTEENTRWYRQRGRLRRICRACSRMHHGFKAVYKPRQPKGSRGSAAGYSPATRSDV